MLAKTGLLIVTNPKQIGKILPSIQKKVQNTLYIQLLSALGEPFGNFYSNVFTSWPKYSQTIYGIYSQAATHCQNLDVRVLLSGLKYQSVTKIHTHRNIDLVIFDKLHAQSEIDTFISAKVGNIKDNCSILTLDTGNFESLECPANLENSPNKHTVLGGTFDRLHIAHKLLLSEAALLSNHQVTVGITEEGMLKSKILWEMVEDMDTRLRNVADFLKDICPELEYSVVPIADPFGPAITDPSMEVIVVSEETVRGGEKISEIRESKGLSRLEIVPIKLIDEPYRSPIEETKISSSTGRIRLLGTLLKSVTANENIPKTPYIIGLTGCVASGKSGVAKWMELHGADVISCDVVGHSVYRKGKPCFGAIVENFGEGVVGEDGEINRQVLGSIVFKDPAMLQKLNALVWPAIASEVKKMIKKSTRQVVVLEAAVLLTAGWESFCHEVWTTIVPREEAVDRLKARNNLSEDQALARINAQPDNVFYVRRANVVFCTLWDVEYTKEQVDKAWQLLQKRICE